MFVCVSNAFRRTRFLVYTNTHKRAYTLGPSLCKELRHVLRLCGGCGFQSATHSVAAAYNIIYIFHVYIRIYVYNMRIFIRSPQARMYIYCVLINIVYPSSS